MNRLLLLIRAGYPVIYIVSHEEARVLDYLAKIFRIIKADSPNKHFIRWYETTGLQEITNLTPEQTNAESPEWLAIAGMPQDIKTQSHGGQLATEALKAIKDASLPFPALADCLVVFFDLHPYLQVNPQTGARALLVRPLRNAADALRRYYDDNRAGPVKRYKTIVVVAPSSEGLSTELERDLIVIDFPLPESDELLLTLESMTQRGVLRFPDPAPTDEVTTLCGGNVPQQEYQPRLSQLIAGAGRGLTLEDYKLGLNMFSVRQEPLCARHVEDMLHLKAKAINNPALEYTPHVSIELGGLERVRAWVDLRRDAASSPDVRKLYRLPPPRGALICGVSGGGKSQLAKLIAKQFNLALLRLDVGALFGMYVGESEERTRLALRLAEVLAPVVLWLDEVDKAFKGMGAGGDNGVSARVFGYFLTWLAEKQDSIFVVATANDFRTLLGQFPEFGRKGRFDEIFWVGLPTSAARKQIFEIYLRPHLEAGYLRVSDSEVELVTAYHTILEGPVGATAFERLCWSLGHDNISANMTGAEIEYAVSEALYRVYEDSQHGAGFGGLTASVIADTVKAAMNRALYRPGSPDHHDLGTLEKEATDKNWLIAD